jgi:hypothetical protein
VYALPVSTLCSGCDSLEKLNYNIGVLQNLKKLSKRDMDGLISKVKPYSGNIVENYKRVFGEILLFHFSHPFANLIS